MADQIPTRGDEALLLIPYVTMLGFFLPPALPFEDWTKCARFAEAMESFTPFAAADLMLYAQRMGKDYEERAVQFVHDLEAFAPHTLMNAMGVARAIPIERRRKGVRFSHYRQLTKLSEPQQDWWIEHIAQEQVTVSALERRIREAKKNGHADRDGVAGDEPMDIHAASAAGPTGAQARNGEVMQNTPRTVEPNTRAASLTDGGAAPQLAPENEFNELLWHAADVLERTLAVFKGEAMALDLIAAAAEEARYCAMLVVEACEKKR